MPDVLPAAAELSTQVVRLTRQMSALRTHVTNRQRHGIEWSSYVVLLHLCQGGPMRSNALAEQICADPSTVSRQVAGLVDEGWVERLPDPDDGRAVQLAATAPGRALFERARAERDGLLSAVLAGWTVRDILELATLMERFTTDLERHRPFLMHTDDALET